MQSIRIRNFFAVGAAAILLLVPVLALAQPYENTVINANIGSTISLTTSGSVGFNIDPTASGSASSAADTVTVSTNNAGGYTLTLEGSSAATSLVDAVSTEEIDAHLGTIDSPTTLATNSWGYRADGVGSFGAGPTSPESNQANLSGLWAGVPASGTPDTLINENDPPVSGSAITTVYYGAKADTSKPVGTYTSTVVYTATAK